MNSIACTLTLPSRAPRQSSSNQHLAASQNSKHETKPYAPEKPCADQLKLGLRLYTNILQSIMRIVETIDKCLHTCRGIFDGRDAQSRVLGQDPVSLSRATASLRTARRP